MTSALNTGLQISSITILSLTCLFLIKHARSGRDTWTGIGLIFCVLAYILIETPFIRQNPTLFFIAITGSVCIPVFFFLLTKAIFDDHFKASWQLAGYFSLIILAHFSVYLRGVISFQGTVLHVCRIVSEIVSVGFVLAGLYIAIITQKADLIEERRRFRSFFVFGVAYLIGITIIAESTPIMPDSVEVLQILQRSSIIILTTFFLLSNFDIKSGFFFQEPQKEKGSKSVTPEDTELRKKLDIFINEKKIYRNEGLTIGQLAEMLNEQEYKVRRHINGELGFRNFNDFLNKYRVTEACQILRDPAQNRKTILEIAYALGYQSIGPFNKAFKDFTQTTPTAYRKASKH